MPEELFQEDIETERSAQRPLDIFPENWDAVLVFLDLRTSWRQMIPPMGGQVLYQGLIQADIWSVIRHAHGLRGERAREVYRDIRVMEGAALAKLNEPVATRG